MQRILYLTLRKWFFFVLLSLMIFDVKGQSENQRFWTLKQCIEYAVNNNLTIKYYDVATRQKEVALNNAKMNLLPTVSGNVNQSFGFGRSLTSLNTYDQSNTSNTSFNVGASAVLFQGFYRKNQIEQNKINFDIAKNEQENYKNDLVLNIITLYLNVLLADELRQVNLSHLELSRSQYLLIKRQVELGRRSHVDEVSAWSVVVQDSATYVSSINDYELSLFDLCQLLEVSKDSFCVASPNGDVEFQVIENPNEVFNIALKERPEIKVAELRVASAEKQIDIARSSFYPTLTLNASIGSNYYKTDGIQNAVFSEQMRNNFSQSVNLSLSIPMFNAFSSRNSVRSAELQHQQSELQLDIEKKNLLKAIEQAYNNVLVARSKYTSCQSVESASNMTYDMVKTKFNSGKATRVELDQARLDWVHAESSLVVAKYELIHKIKIFEFYKNGVDSVWEYDN